MPRILVLGDLLLDLYTWGNAERISPEAPVPVLQVDREERRLGGAASVGRLLRGMAADVVLAGIVGDDRFGAELREELESTGIDDSLVLNDPTRCTTVKERLVGRAAQRHPHQMLRIDRESREPLSHDLEERLCAKLDLHVQTSQAVLIADYAKGVCTDHLVRAVIDSTERYGVPVAVDPARGSDFRRYQGATVIKPNRHEAELATGLKLTTPAVAQEAAERVRVQAGVAAALVTLDSDGMVLAREGEPPVHCPTRAREVYDITGAGDMVLAMLGLCLANKTPWDETLALCNAAAGLEVERLGVAPVSWAEIRLEMAGRSHVSAAKQVTPDELSRIGEAYRLTGKRIVFTNGCFDLLHVGHAQTLQQAASLGDVLIVGVNSDASVRRLKGPDRPVIHETNRAAMLAALGCVTHVVVFADETPHALLRSLKPHVLVKGGTYTTEEVVGREVVEAYGGEVRVVGAVDGVSTTSILNGVRSR